MNGRKKVTVDWTGDGENNRESGGRKWKKGEERVLSLQSVYFDSLSHSNSRFSSLIVISFPLSQQFLSLFSSFTPFILHQFSINSTQESTSKKVKKKRKKGRRNDFVGLMSYSHLFFFLLSVHFFLLDSTSRFLSQLFLSKQPILYIFSQWKKNRQEKWLERGWRKNKRRGKLLEREGKEQRKRKKRKGKEEEEIEWEVTYLDRDQRVQPLNRFVVFNDTLHPIHI